MYKVISSGLITERDIDNNVVAEVNGFQIIRSVTRDYDKWTGEIRGRKKVYYDVCDDDGDLLDSFKTLQQAKAFCRQLGTF